MPRHRGSGSRGEELEHVVQTVPDIRRSQDLDPRRSQLDGQGNAVQPAADLHHGRRVLRRQLEPRHHVMCPLHKETARLRLGGVHIEPVIGNDQREDQPGPLPSHAQGLPTGGKNRQPGALPEQAVCQLCTGFDQMLAVVQDQQRRSHGYEAGQRGRIPAPYLPPQAHRLRNGRNHEPRLPKRRQLRPVHRRSPRSLARHQLQREPGLPAPGGTREGDQAYTADQLAKLPQLPLPADEAGQLGG